MLNQHKYFECVLMGGPSKLVQTETAASNDVQKRFGIKTEKKNSKRGNALFIEILISGQENFKTPEKNER